MTDTIHSCSYYCDRPDCIKRQRDELRERLEQTYPAQQPLTDEQIDGVIFIGKLGRDSLRRFARRIEALIAKPVQQPLTDREDELLLACVHAGTTFAAMAACEPQDSERQTMCSQAYQRLRAAIAKATGGAT